MELLWQRIDKLYVKQTAKTNIAAYEPRAVQKCFIKFWNLNGDIDIAPKTGAKLLYTNYPNMIFQYVSVIIDKLSH